MKPISKENNANIPSWVQDVLLQQSTILQRNDATINSILSNTLGYNSHGSDTHNVRNNAELRSTVLKSLRSDPVAIWSRSVPLISHLRTQVEELIAERALTRAEIIKVIGSVFRGSPFLTKEATIIADKWLPIHPNTSNLRLRTYKKIAIALGKDQVMPHEPLKSYECIIDLFNRCKMVIEYEFGLDIEVSEEIINYKAVNKMLNDNRLLSVDDRYKLEGVWESIICTHNHSGRKYLGHKIPWKKYQICR